MSSSPDLLLSAVLRGSQTDGVHVFRLDDDLRPAAARRRLGAPILVAELAAARAAAEAQGYAAGWAAGQRAARAAAEVELDAMRSDASAVVARRAAAFTRALAAVECAADELERRVVPMAAECDETLAAAAVTVAEALLGRELTVTAEPVRDAVRRALALAPHGRPVVLRLHPEDAAVLTASAPDPTDRAITVVPDPSVERGGCVAECDATRIDAQLGPALTRVREVLAP